MSMNWNKCDIIAIDTNGKACKLKDVTMKLESEKKGKTWTPKTFSFSATIEEPTDFVKDLLGVVPRGKTIDLRKKPMRLDSLGHKFYTIDKLRCPRKMKKLIKKRHGDKWEMWWDRHYRK